MYAASQPLWIGLKDIRRVLLSDEDRGGDVLRKKVVGTYRWHLSVLLRTALAERQLSGLVLVLRRRLTISRAVPITLAAILIRLPRSAGAPLLVARLVAQSRHAMHLVELLIAEVQCRRVESECVIGQVLVVLALMLLVILRQFLPSGIHARIGSKDSVVATVPHRDVDGVGREHVDDTAFCGAHLLGVGEADVLHAQGLSCHRGLLHHLVLLG